MHIAHLGLVELRHLDAHAAPRQHPALGDGGGVHTVALLRLKLCGTLARLLCLGLARLLCLPRLLLPCLPRLPSTVLVLGLVALRLVVLWLIVLCLRSGVLGHRHAARIGLPGARVWRHRGGHASLGARLAIERIRILGGPVEATALEAPVLPAPIAFAHEEKAALVARVARVKVTRRGERAALRDETAQRGVGHFVETACGDLHERRGGRTAQRADRGIAADLGEHAAAAHEIVWVFAAVDLDSAFHGLLRCAEGALK